MKKALKQIGMGFLALFLIFFLFLWTQDDETIERWARYTGVTAKLYDYWEWGRYEDDFKDIAFFGHMEATFDGDTTGLGLDPHYFKYKLYQKYHEHFVPTAFINVDNYELMQTDLRAREIADNAGPLEIGNIEINIKTKQFGPFLPLYYKVTLYAGNDSTPLVYESSSMNLCKKRTLLLSLESCIQRETLGFAKKFYRIKRNRPQLRELYKSVYLK